MSEIIDFTNDWYDLLNDAFNHDLMALVYIYLDAIEDSDNEPYYV